MKKIKLSKCCYIFEKNNGYFYNKEESEKEKFLTSNYYDNYYQSTPVDYETEKIKLFNGEELTKYKILLNNLILKNSC